MAGIALHQPCAFPVGHSKQNIVTSRSAQAFESGLERSDATLAPAVSGGGDDLVLRNFGNPEETGARAIVVVQRDQLTRW